MKISQVIFSASISAFIAVSAASAQSTASAGSEAIVAAGEDTPTQVPGGVGAPPEGIQEIAVTANKREQRLNDVGSTVAVLGNDALKARQITSLADMAQAVPGLSFSATQSGTPVYTLRGVTRLRMRFGPCTCCGIRVSIRVRTSSQ